MSRKICVVGLGYVGLPLAVLFGKKQRITGFDINKAKIESFQKGMDPTREVGDEIKKANIFFTDNPANIKKSDFIIIAVPTPVDEHKKPDMSCVEKASKLVGRNLSPGSIVVYESTVYPGVTEDICVPILEKESSLKLGIDFKIGFSPERINPGDKEHTPDKIMKVVSGSDSEALDTISEVYSSVIPAGIHKAPSIKVAEAAKVIENVQRDLNIALMNELSIIFEKLGINTKDVIEAAGTKWNFHKYTPGLVGGHCIGVDPYYLTYKALELGHTPRVILAGREINDSMAKNVVDRIVKELIKKQKNISVCKVLVLGLSFKENVNDPRNSKAKDLIKELKEYGLQVIANDPLLTQEQIDEEKFGVKNTPLNEIFGVDCVIMTVPHKEYLKDIEKLLVIKDSDKLLFFDIKGAFDKINKENINYFSL
ncbi:nucleotide sugar dehydrogenase [Candidatus Woesearchaeota archaeon]|nr:nucleotide sugar dehydrogenase [Candidatus Woesearchaeota archaeon]